MIKIPRPAWNINSGHAYGIFSPAEALYFDRMLEQVGEQFGVVSFLEIGVAEGATMAGIYERCDVLGVPCCYTGVDGECGRPKSLPDSARFICGDSTQVHQQVGDGFNVLFVDASHALNFVCLDFLNYGPKLIVGGLCIFHDTRDTPEWQGVHFQGTGDPNLFENKIAVRLALKKLGLLQGYRRDWEFVEEIADVQIQGMMIYKKLSEL